MTTTEPVATMQIQSTITSVELQQELRLLYAERFFAVLEGLSADPVYMSDLLDDITAAECAYAGVVVTEIATLRAELGAPLVG